ncbi:TIGR03750 family conjugal transfer protein [Phocoenobacter skyensis]|uniref:TIGR03750 family conjugal transfer protein n=1 Tax=Phocoenobacter skyensis TaxID=97481 RepID=UPI0027793FBD|nr:TIGR03750 family conjugal transfer protein [Pasteurella skyensis]MDP8185318.1 TIGR03750 family conjugal transfer protein [Pasteurella skyensis]
MSENSEYEITFLPTRLNREPTVFGGMTISEFGISAVIGFVVGLFFGLLLFFIFGNWLFIPSLAMLLCIVAVLVGKVIFARIKRGKPEGYLNRLFEYKFDGWFSTEKFIRREGVWATRRSKGKI